MAVDKTGYEVTMMVIRLLTRAGSQLIQTTYNSGLKANGW
jgi:hypothetical protein